MALLSKREREAIRLALRDTTDETQRESLIRELKADDESMAEGSVDSRLAIERK